MERAQPCNILAEWKRFYKSKKLDRYASWPSDASIPAAQWMQKGKNRDKYRPVIMCGGHPLRPQLNMAGRGEMFLLAAVLASRPHVVLWSTMDLTRRLTEWSSNLEE